MFKFFKDYFIFSHQKDGYTMPKIRESIKVSKKERLIWLIVSYTILMISFLVFLIPFDFYINLFLWIAVISIPIWVIFNFDFRIFKIMRLYYYSESKNINKRLIYEGYRYNNYRDVFLKVFYDFGKKNIWEEYTSYSYRIDCFWKKNNISLKIKPYKIIINFNGKKEIIRKNSLTLEELFQQLKKNIK